MGSGLIYGALAGFGKGMVEIGKQEMAHENDLERMGRQKAIQLDLERARSEFTESYRQKRASAIQSAADPRIQAAQDTGPIRPQDQNRILAEEAARYDGKFGDLYAMDRHDAADVRADRREDIREKQADRQISISERQARAAESSSVRAANADRRAQEEHNFTLGQKRELDVLQKQYRTAALDGNTEAAARLARALGITKDDKSTTAQLASSYANLARQEQDFGDAKLAAEYRQIASQLLGAKAQASSPQKAGPTTSPKRPQVSLSGDEFKALQGFTGK